MLLVNTYKQRTTNNEQRTTNNEQRTTNNEQRTTNNEQRTTRAPMTLQSLMHIQTNHDGMINRRSFLRRMAVGAAGLSVLGWKDQIVCQAEELRKQGMACILLYMRGRPSPVGTFDPNPLTPTARA